MGAAAAQQRRRERQAGKAGVPLRLVEAVVEHAGALPCAARTLVVHLPGGARMEIADASQAAVAAALLRTLAVGGAGC